jgi:uncharacterized protein (DUF1697 family)
MPVLREALADAGFSDVRTYVQSGNVVLRSSLRSADEVGALVRKVVAERFDVDTTVVVRSGAQLAKVLAWNPFPEAAAERPHLVAVLHLASKPEADAVDELLAEDYSPVRVAHRGQEVVVDWNDRTGAPKVDRALKKVGRDGTARNWRTLTALVDLTRD